MELQDAKCKIRCEMGACNNMATKTVKMRRVGIRSSLHICDACLKELYERIGETLIPKSIETAAKKGKKQ
ncbi:MAG: hypothetical protein K2L51_06535 [Clostridiales bacterium]|nr:hypothetical protein [Clostridiales bacterium]